MKKRLKVGDVIQIPVAEYRVSYAQLLIARDVLFVLVGSKLWMAADGVPKNTSDLDPIFWAWTLDAKIYHGHWAVVGNWPVQMDECDLPIYKVGYEGRVFLESFSGQKLREASSEEVERVPYRTTISPIAIERCIKRLHGLSQDDVPLDECLIANTVVLSDVV
ncbi:hypothetical protein [Phenylobacterium sp.]|uniref:hypothetical protein n=1 Tax=Phenylobacterium sp. TaxID=1871053 RepID=UPI00289E2978|nr:hypothetical protein [Phenylobacterium sp.]